MSKIIRLTEGELHRFIKKLVESSFEDETEHEYEDVPDTTDNLKISFEDDFDDDYNLEKFDEFEFEPEDLDKEMKTKSFMKQNKPSSVSMGGKWQAQEPYNPIKPSDMPLDKYLKMKKLGKDDR